MKITMIVVCFGLLLPRYAWCGSVHFLVTDQEGRSVPEAFVQYSWGDVENDYFVERKQWQKTDAMGRLAVTSEEPRTYEVKAAVRQGYRYEKFLNPNRLSDCTEEKCTEATPFRIVLRKLMDEKACLVECPYVEPTHRMSPRVDIDLFQKFRNDRSYGKRYRYVDFTVNPRFDRSNNEWTLSLLTTNAMCGLIVTTNRVFRAPETGYSSHVDVPKNIYTNEAFTLYFRTRAPLVYGMIAFKHDDLCFDGGMRPFFEFGYSVAFFNPTGSRILESDQDLEKAGLAESIRINAFESLLLDHRYPPRPDIRARVENRKRRSEVEKELKLLQDRANECYRLEIKPLRDKNKGLSTDELDKILEPARRKVWKIRDQMRQLRDKLEELDKEILTLVLPESQPANVVQPKNER